MERPAGSTRSGRGAFLSRQTETQGQAQATGIQPSGTSRETVTATCEAAARATQLRNWALLVIGLALYWPLLTLGKMALETLLSGSPVLGVPSLVFSGALVLGALVLPGIRPLHREVIRHRCVLVCGTATSAILLAGVLAPSTPVFDTVLGLTGCAGTAVTVCLLTFGWGSAALNELGNRARARSTGTVPTSARLIITVTGSLLLSFVVRLGTALIMGGDPCTTPGTVCLVAYPALACLPLMIHGAVAARPGYGPAVLRLHEEARTSVAAHRRSQATLIASAAFVALLSILAGIRTSGTELYPIDPSGSRYVFALAFSGALLACAALLRHRPSLARGACWGATIVLAFAGTLLAVDNQTGRAPGINALLVARLAVWALFWTLPLEAVLRRESTPTPQDESSSSATVRLLSAYYLLPQGLSYLLTDGLFILGSSAPEAARVSSTATIIVALGLMACALVIVALLAAQTTQLTTSTPTLVDPAGGSRGNSDADLPDAAQGIPGKSEGGLIETAAPAHAALSGPAPARHAICQAIATEAGLTKRETSVFELLSLGYTVQRIADEECVTPNTVRTHSKGIYRKLDCHSKQEIIDLVARRMQSAEG